MSVMMKTMVGVGGGGGTGLVICSLLSSKEILILKTNYMVEIMLRA